MSHPLPPEKKSRATYLVILEMPPYQQNTTASIYDGGNGRKIYDRLEASVGTANCWGIFVMPHYMNKEQKEALDPNERKAMELEARRRVIELRPRNIICFHSSVRNLLMDWARGTVNARLPAGAWRRLDMTDLYGESAVPVCYCYHPFVVQDPQQLHDVLMRFKTLRPPADEEQSTDEASKRKECGRIDAKVVQLRKRHQDQEMREQGQLKKQRFIIPDDDHRRRVIKSRDERELALHRAERDAKDAKRVVWGPKKGPDVPVRTLDSYFGQQK